MCNCEDKAIAILYGFQPYAIWLSPSRDFSVIADNFKVPWFSVKAFAFCA